MNDDLDLSPKKDSKIKVTAGSNKDSKKDPEEKNQSKKSNYNS